MRIEKIERKNRRKTWNEVFDRLSVRKKLMFLHNFFFLILSLTLYSFLKPSFYEIVDRSTSREHTLITEALKVNPYALQEVKVAWLKSRRGSAQELGISADIQNIIKNAPDQILHNNNDEYIIFEKSSDTWQIVTIDTSHSEKMIRQFYILLGSGLLIMYLLVVIAFELIIIPDYIYKPITTILEADAALQRDDRDKEIIAQDLIPGDEFGQIMSSRNVTVKLLRRNEEELKGTLATLEKIASDLKKKNHLLETAKQNLADQDRLVSLGMLSAGLAHELNTPLSVLHGSVEKLLETTRDSVTIERLQRMLRVTERLRGISESLIDFARARTQKVDTIFLQPIVDEAWSLIQIEPDAASVKFHNLLNKQDYVIGNSDRLLQVFVNLLRNAVNALEGSGTIKVSASKKLQNGRDWLIVTVEDDGRGIDPEILPVIFEPFVTTRLDARGTGLGLAVAEGIIHQHGGVILASNRPSGGACFEITLPSSPKELSDEQTS